METRCTRGGIILSRSSKTLVHEKDLRRISSFRNCERSRVDRFSGRFRKASAFALSESLSAISFWYDRIVLRSLLADHKPLSAMNTKIKVNNPTADRMLPHCTQNRRASSY